LLGLGQKGVADREERHKIAMTRWLLEHVRIDHVFHEEKDIDGAIPHLWLSG
jgi:hypothetical protein